MLQRDEYKPHQDTEEGAEAEAAEAEAEDIAEEGRISNVFIPHIFLRKVFGKFQKPFFVKRVSEEKELSQSFPISF